MCRLVRCGGAAGWRRVRRPRGCRPAQPRRVHGVRRRRGECASRGCPRQCSTVSALRLSSHPPPGACRCAAGGGSLGDSRPRFPRGRGDGVGDGAASTGGLQIYRGVYLTRLRGVARRIYRGVDTGASRTPALLVQPPLHGTSNRTRRRPATGTGRRAAARRAEDVAGRAGRAGVPASGDERGDLPLGEQPHPGRRRRRWRRAAGRVLRRTGGDGSNAITWSVGVAAS